MATTHAPAIGAALPRIEAREKVTGAARYAFEFPADGVAYAVPVIATVAKGRVREVDAAATLATAGVVAVLTHENAGPLEPVEDPDLAVLQSAEVAYRGQIKAVVVADSLEAAREGEQRLRLVYDEAPHDALLTEDHPGLYAPEAVNAGIPTRTERGDVAVALSDAPVVHDARYSTPALHNNPMETHSTLAQWEDGTLVVHDSNQGAPTVRDTLAEVFGLEPGQVRVISPHVGGGFGAKGTPRPSVVLTALAARAVGRPVKLMVPRQQQWAYTGYRTPTIQRVQLGADRDGRLTAIAHDAISQTSTIREFAEQTAAPTRVMYAAPNRRTTHRVTRLDVPTPSWMRAPGECPGMFALESAMDELAIALGLDPIELRVRNEPEADPESGAPWSSRNVVACLREGARRFGWEGRDPTPGARLEGRTLVGTGVASSTYPAYRSPATALARAAADGTFTVLIGAADIGTGARTALTQVAADALGASPAAVTVEIGDSALPQAGLAGGSMGTASWGTAVHLACTGLREQLEEGAAPPAECFADSTKTIEEQGDFARHAFGAQFAEVRVDVDTGEIKLSRLLGVFAGGRIVNTRTARSQLLGGMTMGTGMALHEESVMDLRFGDYVNHDLAGYHVPACADMRGIEAHWIDETDTEVGPLGTKGIGEIGIVGTAAAIANAVFHATGARVRDLPIRLEDVLDAELVIRARDRAPLPT